MLLLILLLLGLFCIGFYYAVQILQWLVSYLSAVYNIQLAVLSPMESILNIMQLTLLLMLVVCVPLILWALIAYVRPALYAKERGYLLYVPVSLLLGILGGVFGWYLSIRIFLPYFAGFAKILNVQNLWSLNYLVGFIITNLFVFFLVFQLPIVIVVLHSLGILKTRDMAVVRKLVVVISLVIGALVTPPDVASQLMVALPFYLLFELSVQYCRFKEKLAARRTLRYG